MRAVSGGSLNRGPTTRSVCGGCQLLGCPVRQYVGSNPDEPKLTGSEMCVGQADIRQIYQGIEGAEAERAVGLLDRDPFSHEQPATSAARIAVRGWVWLIPFRPPPDTGPKGKAHDGPGFGRELRSVLQQG